MDRTTLQKTLASLKAKQAQVRDAWRKTGNPALLQFLVDIMPRVVGAERCGIFILDPGADQVWLHCGTGLAEKQVKVPAEDSLVGRVISQGEALCETDMDNLVGAHGVVDMQTGFVTRSALCVPVKGVRRQQVLGAIEILNKRGGGGFGADDQALLERLARVLQLNIENIFLRQELSRMGEEIERRIGQLEQRLAAGSGLPGNGDESGGEA